MCKWFKSSLSGIFFSMALSSAMIAAPAMLSGQITGAKAASKNYVKLSRNAIGTSQRIKLGLNKSMVLDLPDDVFDILVANPKVADAVTRTSRRIYIFAKEVGETNIFIFDKNGRQLVSLDLSIERDVDGLQNYLSRFIPGSDIKVEIINDNVVLTGLVATPQDSARAAQLAEVFVHKGASALGSGEDAWLSAFGPKSKITNLLQVEGDDQVHLKVTVAEIQRSVAKQLGVDISSSFGIGQMSTRVLSKGVYGLGKQIADTGVSMLNGEGDIRTVLRAMDQSGVMRTLAEPSLTAISGESAKFKVGGEYRVLSGKSEAKDENGASQITYEHDKIEYGINLEFTPLVLSAGRISLKINTEVSEPTIEGSSTLGSSAAHGVTMPGLRKREASTTVELPSGGSMVIAGLLRDDVRQVVNGFPGLSRLPVIGTLFRSRDYQRHETELVIIVTPYLVRPTARAALARPDDNFNPASEGAANFLGRVNRIYGTVNGSLPDGRYHGNPGYIFK